MPPKIAWRPLWVGSILLLVALGLGWELLCRELGFQPSVADTDKTFVTAMDRVEPDSIVIAGSSREQADFDLDTWQAAWDGRRPVNLSIFGSQPVDIVEALAQDPGFHGTVIIGIVERIIFNANPIHQTLPGFYLAAWRSGRWNPAVGIEARLFVAAERWLASRDPVLEFEWLMQAVRHRRWPEQKDFVMTPERQIKYTWPGRESKLAAVARLRWDTQDSAVVDDAARDALIERLREAVVEIESRGGQAILLKLPSFGKCLAWEQKEFPREKFWEPLVARVPAPAIHFLDDPALQIGGPGDCSHMDWRDTPEFTKAWVAEIRKRLGQAGS